MGRMIGFLVKELALVAIFAFPFNEIEAWSRRVLVSAFIASRWVILPPSLLESDLFCYCVFELIAACPALDVSVFTILLQNRNRGALHFLHSGFDLPSGRRNT